MTRGRSTQEKTTMATASTDCSLNDLSEDGRRIVIAIRDEIEKLRKEFAVQLQEKTTQIHELNKEVTFHKEKINKLEEKIDDAEAYERKDALVFSGEGIPSVEPGENCTTVVCDLLSSQLKLKMNHSDISTSHRIGKKKANQEADRRDIIVKLCRRDIKNDIMSACRSIRPKFYVNEILTPTHSTILYVLRQAKRRKNRLVGCSSMGGRVFAWIKSRDEPAGRDIRIPINSLGTSVIL